MNLTAGEHMVYAIAQAGPGLRIVAAHPRPTGAALLRAWAAGACAYADSVEGRN